MTSHSALSVACYKTKYCADVVECCPHEAWQNSLICGTYELNEAEQTRHGGFYNVKYDLESDELAWDTASFQPTSGIFDAKWCHTLPVLATAHADGSVGLWNQDADQIGSTSVDDEAPMCLSLDWSDRVHDQALDRKLAVSRTDGKVSVFRYNGSAGLEKELDIDAHVLKIGPGMNVPSEVWITAFDYWNPSTLWTGGDDGSFKVWDLRSSELVHKGCHDAGVCSMQCNFHSDNHMVTGGYDNKIHVWDKRQLSSPTKTHETGGGVWRLKWHPSPSFPNTVLAACMRAGVDLVDFQENSLGIALYNGHEETAKAEGTECLAYGADFVYQKCKTSPLQDNRFVSCSFYDKSLQLWKVEKADSA